MRLGWRCVWAGDWALQQLLAIIYLGFESRRICRDVFDFLTQSFVSIEVTTTRLYILIAVYIFRKRIYGLVSVSGQGDAAS